MKKHLLLFIAASLSFWHTASAQSITVDYANQHQTITMIGGDMERSASFLQSAANPQEIANWCYKDIENTVCRVSYDKKQELVEGTTNFSFYDNAIESMKMVKISNPDIKFWSTMKSDYNGYNGQNNLPDWICDYKPTTWFDTDKYGVFLADYLELMHDNNVTIDYISISKEWSVITVERAHQIIQKVNSECSSRGVPQPMYGSPASWGVSQGISYVEAVGSAGYTNEYTAFSSHNLNSQPHLWDEFVDACTNLNKPAYCDESGTGSGGRTNGEEPETLGSLLSAYSEKAIMYEAGLQGELMFEPWSRGVSSETRTIYFTSGVEGKRMRSYYVMKNFSNNINQRKYLATVASGVSDIETMAFTNDDEIALWVINSSESDYSNLDLNINNASVNGRVYQYVWDVNSKIQGDASILTPDLFNDYSCDIKAQSINLFIIQISAPSISDEISTTPDEINCETFYIGSGTGVTETLYLSVEEPSSDVNISISGANANVFSINGNTTFSKDDAIYEEPVSIEFSPTTLGDYTATLNITSGSETKTVVLSGTAVNAKVNYYVSETGDDANSGLSASDPMLTVNAAFTAASTSFLANKSDTEYIINVGAGTFETKNIAIASLGGFLITIKGEGANNTTLQGGASMPSGNRLFSTPTGNAANENLKISLEGLKIENYGFDDTSAGGIIFFSGGAAKNTYFSATRCAFSNLQAKDGAVIKSNHLARLSFSQCSFTDIKAINNGGVFPIFNIVRGNLTVENCFFANCVRDYTIVDGTSTVSNEEGLLINSKPLYNWVANDLNLVNNTFVNCGIIKGNDVSDITHVQSLIHLHNPHEGSKGSGGKITATIANNLILGTALDGLASNLYLDINVNNTDPDVSTDANNIILTNCSNNIMQSQSGLETSGNTINASFTYTSSEINFVMDGSFPEYKMAANGILYAVAKGSAVIQQGAVGTFVPALDITGALRSTPTSIGAFEAELSTSISEEVQPNLKIYSTSGRIIVEGETTYIKVYNITGVLYDYQTIKQSLATIPVEKLGIYIVVAQGTDGVTTSKKVLVQ